MVTRPVELHIRQKRGRYKTTFDFSEEELHYIFDNSVLKSGGSVAYHRIPGRMNTRFIRLWWLKYVFLFTLSFAAVMTLHYISVNDIEWAIGVVYAATLAFFCIAFMALSRRHVVMTTFALSPALCVLHDKQCETILAEITKRRQEAMRNRLAQIDIHKPYYEEASKFSWLKEEGIITEQEYRRAREKLTAIRDKS